MSGYPGKGAKRARYGIVISVITPFLRLMNDGKTPFMGDFRDAVFRAVKKAAGAAYRAIIRPPSKIFIKTAAWKVMEAAYMKASDGGELPANARQIMYAARPEILRLAGVAPGLALAGAQRHQRRSLRARRRCLFRRAFRNAALGNVSPDLLGFVHDSRLLPRKYRAGAGLRERARTVSCAELGRLTLPGLFLCETMQS